MDVIKIIFYWEMGINIAERDSLDNIVSICFHLLEFPTYYIALLPIISFLGNILEGNNAI